MTESDSRTVESFLRDLRQGVIPSQPLEFLPGLRLHSVHAIEIGLYSDVHEKFCGFPGGKNVPGKNLNTSKNFQSFPQIGKELRNLKERENHSRSERPPPRRIAGLSARRHPIQAMNRGCK